MSHPSPDPETITRQRTEALAQFRAWVADPLALAVDAETTSLEGEAWEIAAGRVGHPTPALHLRGEPRTEWGERALAMQDADIREQLRGLPHLSVHAGELDTLLRSHHPVAWREEFDRAAIERTCGLHSLPKFADAMEAYAPLAGRWSKSKGLWKFVKLEEACELEGVPMEDVRVHSAPGDVLLLTRLIQAVARRSPESYSRAPEPRPAGESLASVPDLDTWTETTTHTTRREIN